MATPAQILANQSNAQHSTGPKTPEGKAAAARNATKHGLSSAFTVLAHEDQDEFDDLLHDLREEHKPATLHQAFLVDQLAKTQWLLARAQRLEAIAFEHLAGAGPDPDDPDSMIVARMYESNPNALNSLQRYAVQAESSYYKAWRELVKVKQLQNEADLVAHLDDPVRLAAKTMDAPLPNHPAAGPDPEQTQYGYIPQTGSRIEKVHAAARDGSLRY